MSETKAADDRDSPVRSVILGVVGLGIFLTMVFLPAGRLDWVQGWLYVGLVQAGWWINYALMMKHNPDLIKQRSKVGEGAADWDQALQHVVRLSVLAVFVVAGLDGGRFAWAPLPWSLWGVGFALHTTGYAFVIWAMVVNAHFEGFVRIQTDRGHRVVSNGPYGLIRHPGNVGFCLLLLAIPGLLGSAWALIPTGICVGLIVLRTSLEDRFLRDGLDGYEAYAGRVRYRLIPGIW